MIRRTLPGIPWSADPALPWLWFGVLMAIVAGSVATIQPILSVALVLGVAVCIICLQRSTAVLVVLVATVFLEIIAVSGVTLTRLVAPIAVFVIIGALSRGQAEFRFDRAALWAIGYTLWALASALWTASLGDTTFLLASLAIALVYTFAFATLISTERDLKLIMSVVVAASFVVGLFAIASFLGLAGSHTLEQGRASGTAGDANFFAAYELVALPLALALSATVTSPAVRFAVYAALLVNIGAVLTTLSRGGLVTLAAVILMALVVPSRTLFRSRAQKVGAVVLILVGTGVLLKTLSGDFAPRIQAVFNGTDAGGSGREVLWAAAWTSDKSHPIRGLGYGAFPSQANELILSTPGISLTHYALRPHGEQTHNAYLGTLTELGIPGLALFLGVLTSTWLLLRRTGIRARQLGNHLVERAAKALTISLGGWAIASFFLSSETSRPLWIIVGLALALPKLLTKAEASTDRRSAGTQDTGLEEGSA